MCTERCPPPVSLTLGSRNDVPSSGLRSLTELTRIHAANEKLRKDDFMPLEHFYRMALHQTDQDLSEICFVDMPTILVKLRLACQEVARLRNQSYETVRDQMQGIRFKRGLISEDELKKLKNSLHCHFQEQSQSDASIKAAAQRKAFTSATCSAAARDEEIARLSRQNHQDGCRSELSGQKMETRNAQIREATRKFDIESGFRASGSPNRFGWAPLSSHQYFYNIARLYSDEELRQIANCRTARFPREQIKAACFKIALNQGTSYESLLDELDAYRWNGGLMSSKARNSANNSLPKSYARKFRNKNVSKGLESQHSSYRQAALYDGRNRTITDGHDNNATREPIISGEQIRQAPSTIEAHEWTTPAISTAHGGKIANRDRRSKIPRWSTSELPRSRQSRYRVEKGQELDSTILRFTTDQMPNLAAHVDLAEALSSRKDFSQNLCKSEQGKVCYHKVCRFDPQKSELSTAIAARAAVRSLWGIPEALEVTFDSTASPEYAMGFAVSNPIHIDVDAPSSSQEIDQKAAAPSPPIPCLLIPGKRCHHQSCRELQDFSF